MAKRIVAGFMAVIVAFSLPAGVGLNDNEVYGAEKKEVGVTIDEREKEEISVTIDGTKLEFRSADGTGVPFIDSAGCAQIPVRRVLESIGATVSFSVDAGSGEKIIMLSKDTNVIRLVIGAPLIRVNTDILYEMNASPQLKEGKAYMPLRAVLEVLGYSVAWDEASKTAAIEKGRNEPLPPEADSEATVTPIGQFTLPQYQNKEGDRPEVIVNHGYIYYLGKNNDIMQTSFSDLTKSKKIYRCPGWVTRLFNDENGAPRLYYHTNGATMGSPHQFILNTDGGMTELNGAPAYGAEVYSTGGKTFAFREMKFGPDRVEIKNDAGEYVPLGGTENRYTHRSEMDGFNGRRGVYLIGDELYLMATPSSGDAEQAVYKVNIKTDEAVRITDRAYGFQIEGKYLYYHTGKELWKRNPEDGTETSLYSFYGSATDFTSDFAVLNGKLYLTTRNLFFIADAGNRNEFPPFMEENILLSCTDMALRGDNTEQYLICQIGKHDIDKGTDSLWMWVYDKDGTLIMEREGDIGVNSVSVEDGKICYYNGTANQINVEKL